MNKPTSDRYVRRGGPIAQIYHGTLEGLEQALKDTVNASRFLPDTVITLTTVNGKNKTVLRSYKGGQLIIIPADEEAWE